MIFSTSKPVLEESQLILLLAVAVLFNRVQPILFYDFNLLLNLDFYISFSINIIIPHFYLIKQNDQINKL